MSLEERFQKEEDEVSDLARVRDLALYYKELKTRHALQFDTLDKNRTHKLVFRPKVRSVFTSPPDAQRRFRAELIEKLSEVPSPTPVVLYPDLLQQEFTKSVEASNDPTSVKRQLHEFFNQRASDLQHLKFKLLLQWAHFCRTAETLELAWAELSPKLNLIQAELDSCVSRIERLAQDEDFGNTRIKPAAQTEDGNLLFEAPGDIAYSNIARDDIEVALKVSSSSWRSERYLRRFVLHCKWVHVTQLHSIWRRSKEHLGSLKERSIERMKKLTGRDDIGRQDVQVAIMTNINLKNIKRQLKMMQKVKAVHSTFAEKHFNRNEQLLSSHEDSFDAPPVLISSLRQLQYVLESEANKHGLSYDSDVDDGQSLAYHVTHMFPESFELQKQKIVLVAYDASPDERDLPAVKYSNLKDIKAPKIGTVRRAAMTNQTFENRTAGPRGAFKVVLLKRTDWLECVTLTPRDTELRKLQDVRFSYISSTDSLLESYFSHIDVHDLPIINKSLETFTQDYLEKAAKRKALLTEMQVSEKLLKRKYFSTLLQERLSDLESTVEDRLDLPLHCIKALYTLVLLRVRSHKQHIVECCNAFRSVQRRLAMDVLDLGVRDQVTPEKEVIPPTERHEDPSKAVSIEGLGVHFERSYVSWTCPILPTQHTLFMKACNYRLESVHSLANRRDAIEVTEDGVYVKDEFGVYVCYDAAFKDYDCLKAELIKLGSHFIYAYESLLDEQGEAAVDRVKLAEELLELEAGFQRAKLELVLVYLEVYDHTIRRSQQLEIAQILVDLMALRPTFNFEASYFVQAYSLATSIVRSHTRLLRSMVDFQASYEIDVNPRDIDADTTDITNSSSFVMRTTSHTNAKLFQVTPAIARVCEVWPSLLASLDELVTVYAPENNTVLGALELALWETALQEWQESLQPVLSSIEDGNIFDNPGLTCQLAQELSQEVSEHPRLVPVAAPVVSRGRVELHVPSELRLYCNLWEASKLKQNLVAQAEEALLLHKHYDRQMKAMKVNYEETEPPQWEAEVRAHVPSVDDGPGSTTDLFLAVFEMDPRLKANFHFGSPETLKNLILPGGLEELRAAVSYQVMQKQLLQIGLQINSSALFLWEQQLTEIKLARTHSYISKSSIVQWINVLGKKGEGFVEDSAQIEEGRLVSRKVTSASRYCFNIKGKKTIEFGRAVKAYQAFAAKLPSIDSSESLAAILRRARALTIQTYCGEVLRAAYYDSIKLQIFKVAQELRLEMRVLPEEDKLFTQPTVSREGYENSNYINDSRQITNFFHVPADEEILRIPSLTDEERAKWRNTDCYSNKLDFLVAREPPLQQPSPATQVTRLSSFTYEGCLKTILYLLVSQLRHFQIRLYLNQLSSPVLELLELRNTVSRHEQFWTAPEENPDDTLQDQLVVNMLAEAGPQAALMEDIKRAMNTMRYLKQQMTESPSKAQEILDRLITAGFGMMGQMLYGLLHYCLQRDNEYGANQVFHMLSQMTRINSGKFHLHGRPFASLNSNPQAEIVELLKHTLFIAPPETAQVRVNGARLKELSWGLMNLSPQDRNYAAVLSTGSQISLDNYIAGKQLMRSTHPIEALDAQMHFLAADIKLSRLKLAFSTLQSHSFILDPSKYEHFINLYRDKVEWKVDYMANRQRLDLSERELGRLEAESSILRTEIQRVLCTYAIQILEQHSASFIKAASKAREYGIVEDFTCGADGNYLDVTRKVGPLHAFLNAVRNRSSQVLTPTSGPALVITIADLTSLSKRFARTCVRFAETEYRMREEVTLATQRQVLHVLACKEQESAVAKDSLSQLKVHIDKVVNTQLSQKGNKLIYELDSVNRQLKELKNNYSAMETQLRESVRREFQTELTIAKEKLVEMQNHFKSFRDDMTSELTADVNEKRVDLLGKLSLNSTKRSSVNEIYRQEAKKVEETEAKTISKLQYTIKLMKGLHLWNRANQRHKYDQQINELKEQLSSNQYLWDQLSESQRREALLKQELSYTQQALASAEKLCEKLQSQIEEMNVQRLRLQQYKTNKGRRLVELETKAREVTKLDNLDKHRMMGQLVTHNKRLQHYRHAEHIDETSKLESFGALQRHIKDLKLQLRREQDLKLQAFNRLSDLREEVQAEEIGQESLANLWKTRYQELLQQFEGLREQYAAGHDKHLDNSTDFATRFEQTQEQRPYSEFLPALKSTSPSRKPGYDFNRSFA
jgi:hypothetical protein